jgi:uncharacterized sporulation protein YeaH/YhbH (DUF444 family)
MARLSKDGEEQALREALMRCENACYGIRIAITNARNAQTPAERHLELERAQKSAHDLAENLHDALEKETKLDFDN